MAKAWVINSRGLARKIKNPRKCAIKDLALQAIRECPNCKCAVDNSDAPPEWPGLPAGVKFDPSDTELLEHLAGKVDREKSTPHMFIDEFIPTLEQSGGICYTHPENLPGVKKDGSSTHFFHRTSNAYSTGQRKRRKVHISVDYSEGHARWHKTGKTRPVIENGTQKGIKKIMVLYERSKKGFKPVKTNWVMHQYHLGTEEDERDGQLVVSKIIYQTQVKHTEEVNSIDFDQPSTSVSPRTPKTRTPTPSRKKCSYDEGDEDKVSGLTSQAMRSNEEELAQDQNPDMDDLIISLECDEVLDPIFPLEEPWPYTWHDTANRKENWPSDLLDLNGIDTSTPPDFNLADLQFGSQDSFMSWLDWM